MRIIGGGARGDFWAQMLADVFGLEVLRPVYREEATSLGAAICGGVGIGLYRGIEVAKELVRIRDRFAPREEEKSVYDRVYPTFVRSYLALREVFEELGRGRS
jgi:xylulokinase